MDTPLNHMAILRKSVDERGHPIIDWETSGCMVLSNPEEAVAAEKDETQIAGGAYAKQKAAQFGGTNYNNYREKVLRW
ncbi:hypothetical protein [Halorarum salinum]|uniref:Uncharacterized protein n=1 Tax=Halorarum salinum TaxID=2743089 RepID=A0A7D5Q8Y9_9EURY|nr:hypothetical protein [Halobaculum salinum]QLG60279.1 hypothetical protein HUG12_00280 [Halobaculum salinum]